MGITTPARVRNRIQAAEAEISDDVLNEFIADEQAFIEAYAGKTFAPRHTGTGHTWLLNGDRSFFHGCRPSDGEVAEAMAKAWRKVTAEGDGGRRRG